MRKLLVLAMIAPLLAACGGGSSKSGGPTPLSGTIGGRAFTAAEVKALLVGTTTPCSGIPLLGTVGVRAVALQITSYAGACSDFDAVGGPCKLHEGAQAVTVVLAKLDANPPQAAPTLAVGTYTIHDSPQTVDVESSFVFHACFAQEITTPAGDATCSGGAPTAQLSVNGGTLRLDSVTGPAISGHLSVTFKNGGGSLDGDFSATVCASTPDICSLATAGAICTLPGTCAP
jgi:hypothetical protein